jgi:hypothetical protein
MSKDDSLGPKTWLYLSRLAQSDAKFPSEKVDPVFAVFGSADGRDEVFAGEHGLVDMAGDKICVVDTL